MNKDPQTHDLWQGLRPEARKQLQERNYAKPALAARLQTDGAFASEVIDAEAELRKAGAWIPGVQLFRRTVYDQLHRGSFSELGRGGEGIFEAVGFWPKQWATARMFAGTAKGFHIHPPHIPEGTKPTEWHKRFLDKQNPQTFFDKEQWDVMFFLQGRSEFFLVDERDGLPRTAMRFFVGSDADDRANNVVIVIPPGVAHALRVEGSTDAIMVYGTSVSFNPAFEGRIASGVETAGMPEDWAAYINATKG
ncbi:MAG: hypothetical protein ABI254_01235 [Chthoniobacterales bacterium]